MLVWRGVYLEFQVWVPFTLLINYSSDLKNFANSWPSASKFLDQFFLTVGQKIFGNKIQSFLGSSMESKMQLQKEFGSLVWKLAFLSVLLVVSGGGSNTSRWQDTWTNLLECSILNLVLTLWKMIQVTLDHPADCCPLKVSKFQKQIFLFSFEPNKRPKLFSSFCPSL